MNSFLSTIAKAYSERYSDLSSLVFVLPNKRSCSFLLKAFSDQYTVPVISPLIIPITDFISDVADNVMDSRIDLLFRLFACYRKLQRDETTMTFEKFSSWGETILSDFNEIDMQTVDPDEIFKNVYDLNSIKSSFLSSVQKKVLVDYFGYEPEILEMDFNRFWLKYEEGGKTESKKKFFALWQILNPLYKLFKSGLHADGLTTTGGAYREVAEKIGNGYEPFEGCKLVFVGFNALSASEIRIFTALREMQLPGGEDKADFIWDLAPSVFAEKDEPALKYVAVNSKRDNFPAPEWIVRLLDKTIPERPPEVTVISVPSNVMQTKVAAARLAAMFEKSPENPSDGSGNPGKMAEDLKNARIAVVLPDENLLLPLLYSLPPEIKNPNLTMGFPLKQTPVISFASLLRKLHSGAVLNGTELLFRFEDVKDFMGHPYSRLIFDTTAIEKFILGYEKQRRIMVPVSSLERLGPSVPLIFRGFEGDVAPGVVVDYILAVLSLVRHELEAPKEKNENNKKNGSAISHDYIRAHVEKVYIGTYSDSLIRLKNCTQAYDTALSAKEVFTLADRLIAGETVAFDGKPLEGLQVMGVLETRCLDFDRVIMLSVNERVMPRVGRNSTFIPNIIRNVFGMPPANYQEELFSYYFFRVLGRCREATLTYDSRSSENRTPGPSRYLLQMKYLSHDTVLKEVEARFDLHNRGHEEPIVEKTEAIIPYLKKYLAGDDSASEGQNVQKTFSASALGKYFKCPLQFLYGNVLGLTEEREKLETIDAIDMGTIVHRVIEHLYFPEDKRGRLLKSPLLMTKEFLQGLLEEKAEGKRETRIERETRLAILAVHFGLDEDKLSKGKLRGSASIIFNNITEYVKKIIRADIQNAPFRLWGSEIDMTVDYLLQGSGDDTASDSRQLRMRMIIDRLDQEGEEDAGSPFRIVDYKTGNVHLVAENMDQIFDGTFKAGNIFQLFFYAELLLRLIRKGVLTLPAGVSADDFERNLKVTIYKIPSLPSRDGIVTPSIGKIHDEKGNLMPRKITDINGLREMETEEETTFMDRLDFVLNEILDFDRPFKGKPSEKNCARCEFSLRCQLMK